MVNKFQQTDGYRVVSDWMTSKNIAPFEFQKKCWEKYALGYSGMVVAPTGFGKTFSVFLALIIDFMNNPEKYHSGLKFIWVSPLRSLATDLARAMQEAVDEIGLDWTVEVRNGDTDVKIKQRQTRQMPDVLLLTPESLHLLLAQKSREKFFKNLKGIAIDEWHELLGSKRGVMIELAVAFLKHILPKIKVWGITATIGNLDQAMEVLIPEQKKRVKIVAQEKKHIEILPVYPKELDVLPWAGHLGTKLVAQVVPIILNSKSVIVFTNTRGQSEAWYQMLLESYPDFAGQIALHHGSIDGHIRGWIEEALSLGKLKAVVSTSSLDLGVDFKPVDTVVQVGSSKGVARFMQRAGRSGHSPFEVSKIYFVPTHALELLEVAALKEAIKTKTIEPREPIVLSFDVLLQFLVTLALGGGFKSEEMFAVIKNSHAFNYITDEEWHNCIAFITTGGSAMDNYEEFHKVVKNEEGLLVVEKRRIGMLHRINIGVIVSDAMLRVRLVSGGYIGMIEEYFISKLKQGDKFVLAGHILQLASIKDMTAYVKKSSGKAITPSWLGGRLPLSTNLSHFLRQKLAQLGTGDFKEKELKFLAPLGLEQNKDSHIPAEDEFLVELIKTKEGNHLFLYPFEGRIVHEVMAPLIAHRISLLYPISFSMAMNDYGFELFSDSEINLSLTELKKVLSSENLINDVLSSINATEMAKRKFRDIAVISGMVMQNYPGQQKNNKSLQASSGIIFKVLEEHDPKNILLKQAYTEVFNHQLEEPRLRAAFERINKSKLIFRFTNKFTPLSFPIKVDSLRQSLSSEDLLLRIQKLRDNQNRQTKSKK